MSNCPQSEKACAYYDGELPAEERAQFARHLGACIECSDKLENYQKLSSMMASVERSDIPRDTFNRLHESLAGVVDSGLLRVARTMAAAAVTLMVAGTVIAWSSRQQTRSEKVPIEIWDEGTLSPSLSDPEIDSPETDFAQWMMATLGEDAIDE